MIEILKVITSIVWALCLFVVLLGANIEAIVRNICAWCIRRMTANGYAMYYWTGSTWEMASTYALSKSGPPVSTINVGRPNGN